MEDIMTKVNALYVELGERLDRLKKQQEAVSVIEASVKQKNAELTTKLKQVNVKAKVYKDLDDAYAVQIEAREVQTEAVKAQEDLGDATLIVAAAEEKAGKIIQDAQDEAVETAASRARFVVEAKKLEARKKNLRAEILKEFANGA